MDLILIRIHTDSGADSFLKTFVTLYFVYLVANMLIGVPESHVSTGVHQTVGPCNVTDADLAGHSRQVALPLESRQHNNNTVQGDPHRKLKSRVILVVVNLG